MTWSKWRIGKLREKRIINTGALRFTRLGTANGDEGRAEAIRAAIIFVAARLIDRPLAPEGGFLRDDADAARQNGATPACFTNLPCDEDAFGRSRNSTARAPPSSPGRPDPVVDQARASVCPRLQGLTSVQFGTVT